MHDILNIMIVNTSSLLWASTHSLLDSQCCPPVVGQGQTHRHPLPLTAAIVSRLGDWQTAIIFGLCQIASAYQAGANRRAFLAWPDVL